jgi:hypothetical protein
LQRGDEGPDAARTSSNPPPADVSLASPLTEQRLLLSVQFFQDISSGDAGTQVELVRCRGEATERRDAGLARLDELDAAAREAWRRRGEDCRQRYSECVAPSEQIGPVGATVDVGGTFTVECKEGEGGAPCFKEVPEICTLISGPCVDCFRSLCGGGDWRFDADVPVEVTLVAATDPWKDPRVLATSSPQGKQAVLGVPAGGRLNGGERLFLGFNLKEKPRGPVRVDIRKSR